MSGKIKNVTLTVIFEGSALNRDEGAGGNIGTIKKLSKYGQTYSFISRQAIRHYLFQTLVSSYGWKPSPVVVASGGVVQFDLSKGDIKEYKELDIFGYMATKSSTSKDEKGSSETRKAPLGITKAISLFPYLGDTAFYCNHDLVSRGGSDATPNPYQREEHISLYKVSFSIDSDRVGKDNNGNYVIDDNQRKERIREVLEAIKNGFYAQSSGEANTIIPLFIIASGVKIPSPIFHPYIEVVKIDQVSFKAVGVEDTLKNGWIDSKVFLYTTEKVRAQVSGNITHSWEEFLREVGVV